MSLGTSATLFGVAGQPVIDPTCAVCPFCDATGAWLPLICTLNCTVPAEEVCAAFQMSHDDITALAEAAPAGAEGVNFLPYLLGERTPNWPNSSGAVLGLKPGACGKDLIAVTICGSRGGDKGTSRPQLSGHCKMQSVTDLEAGLLVPCLVHVVVWCSPTLLLSSGRHSALIC